MSALRAAVYCRISSDRDGAGLGVGRQEDDCRALAQRLGWEVAAVYVDNDISAYSGRARPQYRALLDAVRTGEVTAILAWHPDRLHRRLVELEEFIGLLDSKGVEVRTVTAGDLDLATPSGRMNARILGAVAQKEVEQTRERLRAQKAQAASRGEYRGGMRPYGYEADGVTVREDEAQVVREATAAVLAGRSLRALARELNAAGKQAVRLRRREGAGKDEPPVEVVVDWTYNNLKEALVRPRNAGLVATGRAGRNEEQVTVVGRAVWPALVPEETWRALLDVLTDPARRKQDGNAPAWFGSGLYSCGIEGCGQAMRHAPYARRLKDGGRGERRHLYRCSGERAHLTINAAPTDEHVKRVLAELVRDPRIVAALSAGDGAAAAADRERRAVLAARLDATERDYDEDLIDARTRKRKVDRTAAEIAEIDSRLSDAARRTATGEVLASADPGAAFLAAPLDLQRAVAALVVRVEVLPRLTRGGVWTKERLRITPAVPLD